MKVKRDKRSRIRGKRSGGHGFKKQGRGKGSRGGVGMAGTGKKSGHKISLVMMKYPGYLGKKGFVRHSSTKKELKIINLGDFELKMKNFDKKGLIKKGSEGLELNLTGFKVLGKGEIDQKLIINAGKFSERAKEKITAKGGKAIVK